MLNKDLDNISAMLNRAKRTDKVTLRFGKEAVICTVDELALVFSQAQLFRQVRHKLRGCAPDGSPHLAD